MENKKNVVIDEETLKYRKKVGSIIKRERETFFEHCGKEKKEEILSKRKRRRPYEGLSQPEFAEVLSINEDKIYDLEMGRAELRLEYLQKISRECKCDIGYLLGECEKRTYAATDIHNATGLSEKASMVLSSVEKSKDEYDVIFLDIISRIIESYKYSDYNLKMEIQKKGDYIPLSDDELQIDSNYFPINDLVQFTRNLRVIREFMSLDVFPTLMKAEKEYGELYNIFDEKENEIMQSNVNYSYEEKRRINPFPQYEEIYRNYLPDYDDEKIEKAHRLYVNSMDYINRQKRAIRNDLSFEFSSFLRSDFIEGKKNGK